jgi:hypothetical protein
MAHHRVPIHTIKVVANGTPAELRQLAKLYDSHDLPGANLASMPPYARVRRYKNKLIYISSVRDVALGDQWVIELYAHPDFEDVIFEVTISVTYGRISPRVPRRCWAVQT